MFEQNSAGTGFYGYESANPGTQFQMTLLSPTVAVSDSNWPYDD
jgi:hypothetical protein